MVKTKYFLFISLILILLSACNQDKFYFEEVAEVDNIWEASDFKSFHMPVKDDSQKFTMYFILRNNNDYSFSNIYFFTKLKSPNGEVIADTLEYQLAYPSGEWMGFGMGDIKQNTLVYKENLALKDTGVYEISVTQAMRENQLKGIEDISLMIQKN